MVTIGQLWDRYRPGAVFGAIVGLAVNMFLRFSIITNPFLVKVLEYDREYKGLVIVPAFAILGIVIQKWRDWR